jgi:hypothetical protein
MNNRIYVLFAAMFAIGCHSVDVSKLSLDKREIRTCVFVTVTDSRPYVLSGDKSSDFVGIVRGGYGNPFDFTSSSGNSLAKDLGLAIARSLSGSNGVAKYKESSLNSNSDGCKTVTFKITEWKIDAMVNAWFMYDAEVSLSSPKGFELATQKLADRYSVKGSFWNPLGAARENFLTESKKTIDKFLNDEKISTELAK